MLLSPGNSPRHLSSPSPSLSSDHHNHHPPSTSDHPKPPQKTPAILDEDTYVAAIEQIIERDFFPDIPKLRDRLDWLTAVKTQDPVLIRDAQLQILERRRFSSSSSSNQQLQKSNSRINTPASSSLFRSSATPFEFDSTPSVTDADSSTGPGVGPAGVDVSLGLDQFFRRYTSEDNDSFNKIMEKVNRKRKERYAHLLEGEKEGDVIGGDDVEGKKKKEKMDRVTDGYGTSYQPTSTLEGWKYCAKNLLMYHPADRGEVPLTEGELAERLKGLTKEVDRYNTRFHGKMAENGSQQGKDEKAEAEVLYTSVAGGTPVMVDRNRDTTKKYDLEDLRKSPGMGMFYVESDKRAENGYSFVKTPSPAPGAGDESPFVTWGEIEGTPLRLEDEDTPLDIGGSGDGQHFKIPGVPTRDLKAHSLSREAARKIKERSRMFRKPPIPSPMRSGSASPSVRTLSPAAQKFVRKAMAKSSSTVDESLRASYRGNSPGLSTPKAGRSESRLGRDGTVGSKSPSVREGSNPPW